VLSAVLNQVDSTTLTAVLRVSIEFQRSVLQAQITALDKLTGVLQTK
jgi:hypothetical protein